MATEMTALEWVREKATFRSMEFVTVKVGDEETPAGRYLAETYVFKGFIPYQMKKQIIADMKSGKDVLIKTSLINENILMVGKTACEYFKTVYRLV